MLSSRTRRPWGAWTRPGTARHCPAGPAIGAGVAPHLGEPTTRCPRGNPARRRHITRSSRPCLQRPQFPAAAPARAPCTAAAPETAPRRGSAGGTWCRRREPPCPAWAVLPAPPARPAALSDSLRHNLTAAAAAAASGRGCGRREGGSGPAGRAGPGRARQRQAPVHWFRWASIKQEGAEHGALDDSDWV